jgi:hypothetical protein
VLPQARSLAYVKSGKFITIARKNYSAALRRQGRVSPAVAQLYPITTLQKQKGNRILSQHEIYFEIKISILKSCDQLIAIFTLTHNHAFPFLNLAMIF